ncbi:two-component system, response regulator YesN [Gracilibacillus orientalis]|uniref:Two-component system, response regulator YesN n=1 Tax=Gracilibacillus orientalis TaxID=334253 RepID=A0A1I4NW27_9BACI|nr:response regulator transcription factor [Gracilibacillus orientalis]SFM19732.1 two-component system, response regulator YesN [Gracilibacillus orientalis]
MKEFYKILIVDDEMLIRQGIINYIEWESEGYKIIGEASNGEEAIKLMELYRPHIIITDIVMPGMDGIELVKKVKENYPDTEVIVLSSFENFDYVRQTFQNGVADYILKPKLNTKELLQTLNHVTQKQQKSASINDSQSSMREICKKIIEGYQSIRDMDFARKQFPYDTFVLIEAFGNKKENSKLSKTAIKDQLQQHLPNIVTHDIPIQEHSMLFLTNFASDELPKLKSAIHACDTETGSSSIKWILSTPFRAIDELKTIYETSHLIIQQYHFYLPDRTFLYYDNLPEATEKKAEFDLNHMIYLFKRKQFQEAFIYLNEHIGLLSNQYETDVFEFKSWLENIMFNIIVLLGNMKYDIQELEAEKYHYFSEINEAFHVREAISIFDTVLVKVEKKVLPADADTISNIQLLLDYIEDHYDSHLTLSTLADHFHFNPSYLSSYFSKHHQEGFSEYLNHVRIKNAMKMLEETDKPISTISEAVGYSDPSYFTKVFRKLTAKSPSTYRKENKPMN